MTNIFDRYSARDAAKLVGFRTVAMIDYLQRSGVFFPRRVRGVRGRGKERKYEFRDLLVLKAIKRLLDSGASVAALKKALEQFQSINWTADPATMESGGAIIRYLVASAGSVYLVKDAGMIVDLSRNGQLAFSYIIDLDQLHGELRTSLGLPAMQSDLFADIDSKERAA